MQPDRRFFQFLLFGAMASCAVYAALVLNQATYAQVLQLSAITFHNGSYQYLPVRVTAGEFLLAQRLAWGVAIGLGIAASQAVASRAGRHQAGRLAQETRQALHGLWQQLKQLPSTQRWVAGISLAVLTGARIYFGIIKSYHSEEVASYDFFISRGLLAVSSFYPIPNNHVLPNTLSWLFFQLNPDVWFTLRLPVLLTSTAGTVLLFAGLLRFSTFRIALMAVTLFGWVQLSLYNAVAGRGYWLLMTLAGIHFFALLALLHRRRAPRVAWAALLISGILGCFTVPSFVYVVASAATYLGVLFLRHRHGYRLGGIVAASAATGIGAALLYAPLLLLSGWRLLIANDYVVSRPWSAFAQELPEFIWFTEGTLAGQRTIGGMVFFGVLLSFGWLLYTKRLPPGLWVIANRLGRPALWFVLLPYVLLTVQRVLPPERILLYKSLYLFSVLALLLEAWLQYRPSRWWSWVAGASLTLFITYQTFTMARLVAANRQYMGAISNAFSWLEGQPPGRVLVLVNETSLHFLFFAHTHSPRRHWQFDTSSQPAASYQYVVVPPGYRGPEIPASLQPAYHDQVDDIYVLP